MINRLQPSFLILLGLCLTACHAPDEETSTPSTIVSVHVANIQSKTLSQYVDAFGLVEPEPALQGKPSASSKVSSPVAGLITRVLCEEGQYVHQGDVLFELDARSADEAVSKAEVAVEFAQKGFERKEVLYANNNTSLKLYKDAEQQLETAKKDLSNARTQREILRIKAPLSGTISTIHYKIGESISVNTVMADLMDLKRLDVALKVPTTEVAAIHTGQQVEVFADDSASAKPYTGKVIFLSPQVDPTTDTVLVRASFASDDRIRPGQFVSARIQTVRLPDQLAVPQASVLHGDSGDYVMLVSGQIAKQYPVKIGIKDHGWVGLTGAILKPGMQVVTEGSYGLPVQSRISIQQ